MAEATVVNAKAVVGNAKNTAEKVEQLLIWQRQL